MSAPSIDELLATVSSTPPTARNDDEALEALSVKVESLADAVNASNAKHDKLMGQVHRISEIVVRLDREVCAGLVQPVDMQPVDINASSRSLRDDTQNHHLAMYSNEMRDFSVPVASGERVQIASDGKAGIPFNSMLASIEFFSGNVDRKSLVVDNSMLPQFHSWFSSATWKLKVAGYSDFASVAVLCQKLSGAMLNALMNDCNSRAFDPQAMSLNELRCRLEGLFSTASAKFTQNVIDHRFSADTMAQDIKMFRNYATNSSFKNELDRNEYLYSLLREKMTSVGGNVLMRAFTEHGLVLDNTSPFDEYIQQALTIAHKVQITKRAREPATTATPGAQASQANAGKQPRPATGTATAGGAAKPDQKPRPGDQFRADAKLQRAELFAKYNRCARCGWLVPPGEPHTQCDAAQVEKREKALRATLNKGKNGNFLTRPKGNRPE